MADQFDRLQAVREPSVTEGIALALQGFGAGVGGQLPQFQQSLQNRAERRTALTLERKQAFAQDLLGAKNLIDSNDFQGAGNLLSGRIDMINQLGGDPSETMELLQAINSAQTPEELQSISGELGQLVNRAVAAGFLEAPDTETRPAGLIEFESLIADFSPEQKKKAKLIKAGLRGRAMSNALLSAIESGEVGSLTEAKAKIKEAEKFAELTGSSRAKTIDKGFEKITRIDAGIRNIDRAVSLLDSGAGVGAIESLLPSFRAASVALDNIQGTMALDVVGATTFGALSKGELDLAREIALPTGLDTDELIQHLRDKKIAQEKLRDYYGEQIQFLDQGGTVAGFLRQKERDFEAQGGQQAQQQAPAGAQDLSGLSIDELIQMRQQAQ